MLDVFSFVFPNEYFKKHFYLHVLFVQRVSLWHFHTCLQCTLVRFIYTTILPHSPSLFLKWFWQVSVFYFHKVHWPYSPTFIFSIHPPTSSTLPFTGPVLHPCPSLFKCILIVQRGFAMVFHQWIYCILFGLNPSITTLPYLSPIMNIFQKEMPVSILTLL
jgi:hypothetical protein